MTGLDMKVLLPMVSLGLMFVLIATGAYKRSITTTIYTLSVVIALQCATLCQPVLAAGVVMAGLIFALVRAIILGEDDRWLRGR